MFTHKYELQTMKMHRERDRNLSINDFAANLVACFSKAEYHL